MFTLVSYYFYSEGQAECLDCPQSYYCGLEGAIEPLICTPGSYCPVRTVYPTPCPRGTYSPAEGLSKESECTPCTAGWACTEVGLNATNVPCAAGFYCLTGSPEAEPNAQDYGDVCPAGYYCPEGNSKQVVKLILSLVLHTELISSILVRLKLTTCASTSYSQELETTAHTPVLMEPSPTQLG